MICAAIRRSFPDQYDICIGSGNETTNTSCRTVGVMGVLSAYGHGLRANFFMLSEYSTNATAGFWGREREAQIMYLNSSMQACTCTDYGCR